jgi:PAS domain S-box-containing protein
MRRLFRTNETSLFATALFVTAMVLAVCTAASAVETPIGFQKKKILVIHSYYKGFTWTDGIDLGIVETLKKSGKDIDVYTEFMDSKRFPEPQHITNLYTLYRNKYARTKFDCVICADDNAFQFLLMYRDALFPNVPVVFCGVNDFTPAMLKGKRGFTGVVETINPWLTLKTAIALHPGTTDIKIVVDCTPTGVGTAKKVLRVLSSFPKTIHFTFYDHMDMSEIVERVRSFSKGTVVLLMNFNRDRSGNSFSHLESIALLRRVSRVPIYGLWDFHIGRGIVGGVITSSYDQGRTAALIALRVLRGEPVETIGVVTKPPTKLVFDYNEMKRFGIRINDVPAGSNVINGPKTFYTVNKQLIWFFSALFAFLCATTTVLILNIMQRRRAQTALSKVHRALLTLSGCNQAMAEAKNEPELLKEICRIIVEVGGYPLAWVGYVGSDRESLLKPFFYWKDYVPDGGGDTFERGVKLSPEGPTCRVIREGRHVVVRFGDAFDDFDKSYQAAYDLFEYSSHIILPLRIENRIGGVLNIYAPLADAFDNEEIDLLTKLADNLSYGIMMQRLAVEREKAEEELVLANEKLSMLLESLPIVPFICNHDKGAMITYVSQVIGKVTGYSAAAFTDDSEFWLNNIHREEREHVATSLDAFDADGRQYHKYRFRCADGSYRWFYDVRHLVKYIGEENDHVVGAWQDITKEEVLRQESEMRLQQLVQADKLAALGEIVASMAHEINNPNSFISYNIPLLRETWQVFAPMVKEYTLRHPEWRYSAMTGDELSADMEDIIKDIAAGSQRIDKVVTELKEYACSDDSDAGKDVQINEVVTKALNIVGPQIRKSFVKYTVTLAPELPAIFGHLTKLEQVVANLVVNATKAVPPKGRCRLGITTQFIKEFRCVAIHVEDDGVGIDPGVGHLIFDPFFTTRKSQGGTGLGLSVSQRIVREHNGQLDFLSRPGCGTRFTVYLPIRRDEGVAVHPSVLWVGANEERIKLIKSILEGDLGAVEVVMTNSEASALAILDTHPEVKAAAIDIDHFGKQGWAIMNQIARKHPLVMRVFYGDDVEGESSDHHGVTKPDIWLTPPLAKTLSHSIFSIAR